jgi:hypothetical protein
MKSTRTAVLRFDLDRTALGTIVLGRARTSRPVFNFAGFRGLHRPVTIMRRVVVKAKSFGLRIRAGF